MIHRKSLSLFAFTLAAGGVLNSQAPDSCVTFGVAVLPSDYDDAMTEKMQSLTEISSHIR
jgi:uncharacterized membrane protein